MVSVFFSGGSNSERPRSQPCWMAVIVLLASSGERSAAVSGAVAGSPFAAGRPWHRVLPQLRRQAGLADPAGQQVRVGEVLARILIRVGVGRGVLREPDRGRPGSLREPDQGRPGSLRDPGRGSPRGPGEPGPRPRPAHVVGVARQPVPPVAALCGGTHPVSVPAGHRVRRGPVLARRVARAALRCCGSGCSPSRDRLRCPRATARSRPATARPRPPFRRGLRHRGLRRRDGAVAAGRPGASRVPGDGGEAVRVIPGRVPAGQLHAGALVRRRPAGSSPRRRPGCSG